MKSRVDGVLSLGAVGEELQHFYKELGLVPHRLVSSHSLGNQIKEKGSLLQLFCKCGMELCFCFLPMLC